MKYTRCPRCGKYGKMICRTFCCWKCEDPNGYAIYIAKDCLLRTIAKIRREAWQSVRRSVIARYGAKCMKCSATKNIQVDHIKPKSKYPKLWFEENNLQVLCRDCNFKKGLNETDYRRNTNFMWSESEKI